MAIGTVSALSIALPGQVWGLAAADPAGPLYVTSYAGRDLRRTVLQALDPAGTVLWSRWFDGRPGRPRVSAGGTVWIAHDGPAGQTLTEVAPDGTVLGSMVPEQERPEQIGAFVLLPDGPCVAWVPAPYGQVLAPGRSARVARYDRHGGCRWSTPAVLADLSLPAITGIRAGTGGRAVPVDSWTPTTVDSPNRQPLLVSGRRIAATYRCGSSGIAVTFLLDTVTGRLVATTTPGPDGYRAISGREEFVIGWSGYGSSRTFRVDAAGVESDEQFMPPGMWLVDRCGELHSPAASGPPDPDIAHPALDRDGTAVFWRGGKLLTTTARGPRELLSRAAERPVPSRTLLLDRGRVCFALYDELLVVDDTGLGPLDTGVWPCDDSALSGNPVTHQE